MKGRVYSQFSITVRDSAEEMVVVQFNMLIKPQKPSARADMSQKKYKPSTSQTYIESIIAQADLLSDMLFRSTLQYENITDNLMEALTKIMITPTFLINLPNFKGKKTA